MLLIRNIVFFFLLVFGLMLIPGRNVLAVADVAFYGPVVWEYLEILCGFGPRYFNSDGIQRTRELIIKTGQRYAAETRIQRFNHIPESGGKPIDLLNIELRFGPKEGRPLLLGTHYDTRPRSDEDPDPENRLKPILGANDGGSGTALLLGLARALSEKPPSHPVVLVFFDGEDFGEKGSTEYLLGSKYYASIVKLQPELERPAAVLVLDMVGDKNLEIYPESYSVKSAPQLVKKVFLLAREKHGLTQFKDSVKYSIIDDHIPFTLLGIPAMVLIDFDYPHWHKQSDTLENCSSESLMAVFYVMMDLINEWTGRL